MTYASEKNTEKAKSLSDKGSDPLAASRFRYLFGFAREYQTPFPIGSKTEVDTISRVKSGESGRYIWPHSVVSALAIVTFGLTLCAVGCVVFGFLATFVTAEEPTQSQKDFVAKITGDWKIQRIYKNGAVFKGPPLNATGVRVNECGLVFLGQRGQNKDQPYRFTAVHDKEESIELKIEIDHEIHRYVLKMDGDLMWLVTRLETNSELPVELKPTAGNFCIALLRSKNSPPDK